MTAARVVHVGLAGSPHDITIEPGLMARVGALDTFAPPQQHGW